MGQKAYFTKEQRRLVCPRCADNSMRRIAREGFLQKHVLPFFEYYPWECAKCRMQKLFRDRGERVRRSSAEHSNEPSQ